MTHIPAHISNTSTFVMDVSPDELASMPHDLPWAKYAPYTYKTEPRQPTTEDGINTTKTYIVHIGDDHIRFYDHGHYPRLFHFSRKERTVHARPIIRAAFYNGMAYIIFDSNGWKDKLKLFAMRSRTPETNVKKMKQEHFRLLYNGNTPLPA